MQYISYEARRTRAAEALADNVFRTPELLERGLVEREHTHRILRLLHRQQDLQKHHRRLAEAAAQARSPARTSSGAVAESEGFHHAAQRFEAVHARSILQGDREGPKMAMELLIGGRAHEVKKPGSRLRSVQLTEPHMQDLKAYVLCSSSSHVRRYPSYRRVSMHNGTGITIGQLYDKLRLLRREHSGCASA